MTAKVMRNYKLPVEQVHSEKRRDQTPTFPKLKTSIKKNTRNKYKQGMANSTRRRKQVWFLQGKLTKCLMGQRMIS